MFMIINPNISIIDNSFFDSSFNKTIVLKFSRDNFAYSVFDSYRNMFVAFESWYFKEFWDLSQISKLIDENSDKIKILKQNYYKIVVIIDTPIHTLIPDEIYSFDKLKSYLTFNHFIRNNEIVLVDDISNIISKNIYWLPLEIDVFISKYFTNYKYCHISSIFLNPIFIETDMSDKVFVNISGNTLLVIVTEANKLKYCNTFVFKSAEDLIFYLLNMFKQLKLNPDSVPLILVGEFDKKSAIYNLIYRYIRNVSFGNRPTVFQYFSEINNLNQHYYFSIFNSVLCV